MKKKKKTLIIIGIILGVILLLLLWSSDFKKRLWGTNWDLIETDDGATLGYRLEYNFYQSDIFGCVHSIQWNENYIVAHAHTPSIQDEKCYYIIEQLETDTFIYYGRNKVAWTTYNSHPWITEQYYKLEDYQMRLEELNIDTLSMFSYSWKYRVGIY